MFPRPREFAADLLLRDINRAIAQGIGERPILVARTPAIVIEWEGPMRRWQIREGFRPVLGETITLTGNFLLLFHPRERVELILGQIDPLVPLAPAPPVVARPPQVNIPSSVRGALHSLQQREDSVEYGGGIDFEVMRGRAEVERLLVFLGGFREVPGSIRQKFADDVEVEFHTHPDRILGNPSLPDLLAFSDARQRVALIVARDDMLLLFKQPGFVPLRTEAQICELARQAGVPSNPSWPAVGFAVTSPIIQERLNIVAERDRFMRDFLRLDTERVPRSEPGPLNIPLDIVQVPSR